MADTGDQSCDATVIHGANINTDTIESNESKIETLQIYKTVCKNRNLYDVSRLKRTQGMQKIQTETRNRFQQLSSAKKDVNENWVQVKEKYD